MSSSKIYGNKFEELLAMEERMRSFCEHYLDQLKDPILLGKFREIYEDEKMHNIFAQYCIKLTSNVVVNNFPAFLKPHSIPSEPVTYVLGPQKPLTKP